MNYDQWLGTKRSEVLQSKQIFLRTDTNQRVDRIARRSREGIALQEVWHSHSSFSIQLLALLFVDVL